MKKNNSKVIPEIKFVSEILTEKEMKELKAGKPKGTANRRPSETAK